MNIVAGEQDFSGVRPLGRGGGAPVEVFIYAIFKPVIYIHTYIHTFIEAPQWGLFSHNVK